MDLSPDQLADLRASLSIGPTEERLWAMNAPAMVLFLAVDTQWRTSIAWVEGHPVRRFIGLDYAGARVAIDALGLTVTPEDWRCLQVLEASAAAALNGAPE